jgi:hypothetical protein
MSTEEDYHLKVFRAFENKLTNEEEQEKEKIKCLRIKNQNYCIVCKEIIASQGKYKGKPTHCAKCRDLEEDKELYWPCTKTLCLGFNKDGTKCVKIASSGIDGTSTKDRLYCSNHIPKDSNMKDLSHKKCEKCNKRSRVYGLIGGKPTFCSDCRIIGTHFLLIYAICEICLRESKEDIKASYGPIGGKPIHCKIHKTDEEHLLAYNKCRNKRCKKYATHGPKDSVLQHFCKECSPDDYEDHSHKRCTRCKELQPNKNAKNANYGYSIGYQGVVSPNHVIGRTYYCAEHSEEGMIDIYKKMCNVCNQVSGFIKYNEKDWCSTCLREAHPDCDEVSSKFFFKQNKIYDDIKTKLPITSFNQRIKGSKNRYRPDLLFDLGKRCVIVELDENKHCSYCDIEEDLRVKTMYTDLKKRPLTILRINLDSYAITKTKYQKSMFIRYQKELTDHYPERLEKIITIIKKYIDNSYKQKENIEEHYFFYDFYED